MRRLVALVIGLVLAAVAFVAAPAPASAATPYCGIRWGSLAKSAPGMSTSPLSNIRTGRHACYDRIVLDIAGPVSGYSVRYVSTVLTVAQGDVVPLAGGAKLEVIALAPATEVGSAPSTTDSYLPTNPAQLVDVTGYRTLRQLSWAGTFEGRTAIGVGVRARLPFRVFVVRGPGWTNRIVIDFAHHW